MRFSGIADACGRFWTSRRVSGWIRVLLCDLLFLALLVGWASSRFDLIVHHGLVGGSGDEGHRLVFSYRLCHDFSGNIYSYFFHCPWPPLPYVLQAAAFRLQQAFGGGAEYGTAAICSSLGCFAFAVAFVYAALAMRFQRLAGLAAALLLLSMRDMTTLAVTPMAESYCTFFLGLSFLFAALPQTSIGKAMLVGIALMLATQCRSETIVLSVVFGAYCLHQRGWLAGAACTSIAAFPFVLKAGVNYATGFSGMSYFNLAKYVHFENGWRANAAKALEALQHYARTESAYFRVAAFALLAALCGAVLYRAMKTRLVVSAPSFRSAFFWLSVAGAGLLSACILEAMAGSFVLAAPRYFVICHFLWTLPLAVAVATPLARLGELCGERAALREGFRASPLRWLGAAVSLLCVAVMAGSLYRSARCARETARSLYQEQAAHIPPSVLAANDWLHENYQQGHICYDSLIWWETFLFFHNMRSDGESTQFMVYDRPHGEWQNGPAVSPADEAMAAMHRYIEHYRPALIVLAGPEYRRALESIQRFAAFSEKASYLRPYLRDRESGKLELTGSPYWKRGPNFSVMLEPAFQNDAVAIYRARYSNRENARSVSTRPKTSR